MKVITKFREVFSRFEKNKNVINISSVKNWFKFLRAMKAAKTPKNLKEMPYPPQKKLLKRKGNSVTPAQTNAPIFPKNFFRRPKIEKQRT